MLMKHILTIAAVLIGLLPHSAAIAQQTVTFGAADGLSITADLYVADVNFPYILLLHQARSSRGEYREIAPKLAKLGYNCLAIDQRSGGECGFVPNATAAMAAERGLPQGYTDAQTDIEAAMAYIKQRSDKPIVLWGSSYSASLALMLAPRELRVGALVLFSPGEYLPNMQVAASAAKVSVPVFVASSKAECEAVSQLCAGISPALLTAFCPAKAGEHGAKALWEASADHGDCWLALSVYFSKLKGLYQ